jgi:hypothetical protein
MQAKRGALLLPTLLFIQLSIVSKANFWDGFHETKGDQQIDPEIAKFVSIDGADGYGVDIVRISSVLSKDVLTWLMLN